MATFQISQDLNFYEISFLSKSSDCEYALYIYEVDGNNRKKIDQIWYQKSNFFKYYVPKEIRTKQLLFKVFTRNSKTGIVESFISSIISNRRTVCQLSNMEFSKSFDLDVLCKNWKVPVIFNKKHSSDSKKVFILLNGALKNKNIYPTFHRISWGDKFPGHTLNIYDPTIDLSNEMLLGWYQGNLDSPLINDVKEIVNKLKQSLSLDNSDLVFYGSSGGGWSALKLSETFAGSLAVAINPQINILNYHVTSAVDLALKNSYSGLSKQEVSRLYSDRVEINSDNFKYLGNNLNQSKFILVQNIQDYKHFRIHFKPFWLKFSNELVGGYDLQQRNYALIYDHESGHAGEPEQVFNNILKILSKL